MNKIKFKRTKAEERVLIFRDIIAQLRAEAIIAEKSVYIESVKCVFESPVAKDARDLLPQLGVCRVCQRGAVVLSMVRRHDTFKIEAGELVDEVLNEAASYPNDEYTRQLFTTSALLEMEAAFEGWPYIESRTVPGGTWVAAYPSLSDRMDAICRNGIANKGTFKISQVPAPRRVPLSVEIARRAK